MMSSLTNSPASMIASAWHPSSVLASTASRRISPVEICGTPRLFASRLACVPLPAPGGPSMTMFNAIDDPRYPRRPRTRVFFMKPS